MDTTLTDPLVGKLLDGRYRVESRIARGGMATVYLALDIRLDRTVAVKVMHRSLAEDPAFVRRFIGEAKSVASLSHPNVVHVFDQGTDGDNVYLSMEYVPGRTLRDVLRARGRLPAREALEVMIPVLAALGAAHQSGLVHRDVKPENVLLADDGRVKVVDFGLARAIEATNQTRTGVMIGTIGYMSPEQVTAGATDARSDVYAAGIMLFELLTGRQPYEGETPMSVAYRHVHDTVPVPSAVLPGSPPLLDNLVAAATARDPANRPADATALLVAAVEAHRMLPRDSVPHPSVPIGAPHAHASVAPEPPAPVNHTLIQPRTDLLTGPAAGTGTPPPAVPRPRRSAGARWFLVGLAVVMVIAVGVTGWLFSQNTSIVVPATLVGKNITAATDEAEQRGFVVERGKPEHDEKAPKGTVLRTDPVAGTEREPGSRLVLIASAGPKRVAVPNVVGMSEPEARSRLAEVLITVDDVRKQASETVPRGQVMRTVPAVGNLVKENSRIDLVVSAGLLMPDVRGMPRDQADGVLRGAGFTPEFVEQTDSAQPCTVIAQDPLPKAEIDRGAVVRLTLSQCNSEWQWPWERDRQREGEQPGGEEGDNVVVIPNIVFKDFRAARDELRAAGVRVKMKRTLGRGRVVAQLPPGGQSVPPGTEVTIWY
ncbi:Stk1 family PASTA domain-containing Ser/Thr kinase [Streptosporangium sp. NPDC050855]|uniref:Stk1 family PASTA domain-containing Ser/Thr kinase n=1 Tax=Streptosporangium sp. NPDC050855 TaxID=3366194 RepID=UPI0037A6260C